MVLTTEQGLLCREWKARYGRAPFQTNTPETYPLSSQHPLCVCNRMSLTSLKSNFSSLHTPHTHSCALFPTEKQVGESSVC